MLAPVYQLGSDSFNYSINAHNAHISIFDSMGHGLKAKLLANVAMATCRNSRQTSADLAESAATIDATIAAQFGPERFVTTVLADLDMDSRQFQWSVSGHPPPLLLRNDRIMKVLQNETTPPLNIEKTVVMAEKMLEPTDQMLFFTNSVVEAHSANSEFFGIERLVDMVIRTSAASTPAPETMRRLLHAILEHQIRKLQDNATIVVVEWRSPESRLLEI